MRLLNKILAVLALLSWGGVILLYAARGELQLFVYPMYIPLLVAAGMVLVVFSLLEAVSTKRRSWFAIIPLCLSGILGLVVTPAPLSVETAQNRGVVQNLPQVATPVAPQFRFAIATESMELLDWLRVLGGDTSPQRFTGDTMNITGMFMRQEDGRDHVVRMAISCCIADATPVGLPVRFAAEMPEPGNWVRVHGKLAFDETGTPFVDAMTWERIPLPKDPYAYL